LQLVELYQAEWCPHSHVVRERLTELGVDVTLHQVPAEQGDRHALGKVDGDDVLCGEDEILPWLDERFDERPDAGRHRAKARMDVPQFVEVSGR
jgi:glutathione S-transferase